MKQVRSLGTHALMLPGSIARKPGATLGNDINLRDRPQARRIRVSRGGSCWGSPGRSGAPATLRPEYDQNRCTMPTPAAIWLCVDDGLPLKPSPIDAVAWTTEPLFSVWPLACWYACTAYSPVRLDSE